MPLWLREKIQGLSRSLKLSNDKRDLTRIEDLGDFFHELTAEDEQLTDLSPELPDLPFAEEGSLEVETQTHTEESTFDSNEFGTTEESAFGINHFESSEESTFENSDFENSEETTFSTNVSETIEESTFETSDFETTTFENDLSRNDFTATKEFTPDEESFTEETSIPETNQIWREETVKHAYKTPETFADLKKFSESSSFSGMATEGNPSFSVLVKNVRFIEDVNDIIILLRELSLLADSEEQVKARLMRGMLLVPRISEYAAIYLAHKLRRFDIDIQIGLSDEIHPPKHQETPETGIVSKFNLYQNQSHHFQFDNPKLELSQIIVATSPNLEGYQVLRYMGVASEHKMLDSHIVEDESSDEVPQHYKELAQKLKAHALKAQANAVVGLNYQLTPIPSEFGISGHKYRLTCTGNLVWVNKL